MNFQFGKDIWTTNFEIKYYKPDGTLWADMEKISDIKDSLQYVYVTRGWGWGDYGNWETGKYRVEVWDGADLMAEETFTVIDQLPEYDESPDFSYYGMRFFESDGVNVEKEFKTSFESSSRYIYTELDLKNKRFEDYGWDAKFKIKYFHPSGSWFGDIDIDYSVPTDFDEFNLWNGYGYSESEVGNWLTGDYKVEVWYGETLIGESSFNIK